MNRDELQNKSVDELRTIVRTEGLASGVAVVNARKAQLIDLICDGTPLTINGTQPTPAPAEPSLPWDEAPAPTTNPSPAAMTPEVMAAIAQLAAAFNTGVSTEEVMAIVMDGEGQLMERVKELAEKAARNVAPQRIEVVQVDGTVNDVGTQHRVFPDLLMWVQLGEHVMLTGNAGTGKSRGAAEVAKALNREYSYQPLGPMTAASTLVGYMDAVGKYQPSALRERYEHGGIIILDEMDACNGGVLTLINSALDGEEYRFPDKTIQKHPDFLAVATANTVGRGADRIYVGRQPLDGSTLDRFIDLNWNADKKLEEHLLAGLDHPQKAEWFKTVDTVRDGINKHKVRHVAGFRSKRAGLKGLIAGRTLEQVTTEALRKGVPDSDWTLIKGK